MTHYDRDTNTAADAPGRERRKLHLFTTVWASFAGIDTEAANRASASERTSIRNFASLQFLSCSVVGLAIGLLVYQLAGLLAGIIAFAATFCFVRAIDILILRAAEYETAMGELVDLSRQDARRGRKLGRMLMIASKLIIRALIAIFIATVAAVAAIQALFKSEIEEQMASSMAGPEVAITESAFLSQEAQARAELVGEVNRLEADREALVIQQATQDAPAPSPTTQSLDGTVNALRTELQALRERRAVHIADRDAEEFGQLLEDRHSGRSGRGVRWRFHDARVQELTAQIAEQETVLRAAEADLASSQRATEEQARDAQQRLATLISDTDRRLDAAHDELVRFDANTGARRAEFEANSEAFLDGRGILHRRAALTALQDDPEVGWEMTVAIWLAKGFFLLVELSPLLVSVVARTPSRISLERVVEMEQQKGASALEFQRTQLELLEGCYEIEDHESQLEARRSVHRHFGYTFTD